VKKLYATTEVRAAATIDIALQPRS